MYPEDMPSGLTKYMYSEMTKEKAFPSTRQKTRSGEDNTKTKTQLNITDSNNNKTITRQKRNRNNRYTNEKCKERTALEWPAEKKNLLGFKLQSNLNSSNTDGSFTMANPNLLLSPYEFR